MNNKILWSLIILICCSSINQPAKKIINLQFFTALDGKKILASVDEMTTYETSNNLKLKSIFKWGKKKPKILPLNQTNDTNPELAKLWNNTGMIFGAAADGVGVGTTFAVKKLADGKMVFLTNFHVVEQFCQVPEGVDSDLVENNSFKYPCDALFVLHDVAINTQTNTAEADGTHPWKSEVASLTYFDKKRDLAAFAIELPADADISANNIETTFDIGNLLTPRNNAEKLDPKLPPITVNSVEMSPLTAFALYLPAYSLPKQNEKNPSEVLWIKKEWFKGAALGVQTFENEKKLGFISAIKHNIEVLPGSSGAPLALSDGRIVGINASIEIKQFYGHKGHLWWKKEILETYSFFFAMPATFVKDFLDKII
jgi:hypothetical protein